MEMFASSTAEEIDSQLANVESEKTKATKQAKVLREYRVEKKNISLTFEPVNLLFQWINISLFTVLFGSPLTSDI